MNVGIGGVGIHMGDLWHGSGRNASMKPRRGIGIHFAPGDAVLREVIWKRLLWF